MRSYQNLATQFLSPAPAAELARRCDSSLTLDFEASKLASNALSSATEKAYQSDWKDFVQWADQADVIALPASQHTIAAYLAHLAIARDLKPATIERRVASISHSHQLAGEQSATGELFVRRVLAGIRRRAAEAASISGERSATRQAAPIDLPALVKVCAFIDTTDARGLRDRALLLVGFAGFFRRSELVGLQAQHLERVPGGVVAHLPKSKTDQFGRGTTRAIKRGTTSLDPVNALDEWIAKAEIVSGPIFRSVDRHGNIATTHLSDRSASEIVKRRASAAGIDPLRISGHSLRRGAATTAYRNGSDHLAIARSGGWAEGSRTLTRYIEHAGIIVDSPDLGL